MSYAPYGDFTPLPSRDYPLLSPNASRGYNSPMEMFRDALLKILKETGTPLRQVAASSGVSYEQLKKLKQGQSQTTNVEDAIRVAASFGLTLEQFMSGETASNLSGLVRTLTRLSPEGRAFVSTAAEAQLAAEQEQKPRDEATS